MILALKTQGSSGLSQPACVQCSSQRLTRCGNVVGDDCGNTGPGHSVGARLPACGQLFQKTRWDKGRLKHVGGGVDKREEVGRHEKHPGGCGGLAARKVGRAAHAFFWNNCMDSVPFAEVSSQRGASWMAWVEITHPVWAWLPQRSAQCHI